MSHYDETYSHYYEIENQNERVSMKTRIGSGINITCGVLNASIPIAFISCGIILLITSDPNAFGNLTLKLNSSYQYFIYNSCFFESFKFLLSSLFHHLFTIFSIFKIFNGFDGRSKRAKFYD
jgi:hypothetical protein